MAEPAGEVGPRLDDAAVQDRLAQLDELPQPDPADHAKPVAGLSRHRHLSGWLRKSVGG